MRSHLTWAIVIVLIVLVAGTSIKRGFGNRNPKQSAAEKAKLPEIPSIYPTLSDITNSKIAFFDASGKPLVGYVEKTNRILLFSAANGASSVGDVILPITREKVAAYVNMLEVQAEAERKADEAKLAKEREEKLWAAIQKANEDKERRRLEESNKVVVAKMEEERNRIQESNDAVRAQAELAAHRERYITLNSSFERAVLIVDESNKQNTALSSTIADRLSTGGVKTTISLFKPAFVTDGLFKQVFEGQTDIVNRLPIKNGARTLLLGRQTVTYTSNPQLNDTVTATMNLDLNAITTDGLQSVTAQSIQGIGVGFTKDEARISAEERITSHLTNGILQKLDKALSQR